MNSYNGYTSTERSRAGNFQRQQLAAGVFVNPDRCDICGVSHRETGKKIERHNENYTDFMAFHPLCVACHRKLHNRFTNWASWKEAVTGNSSLNGETDLTAYGDRWFHQLKSYEEPEKRFQYESAASTKPQRISAPLSPNATAGNVEEEAKVVVRNIAGPSAIASDWSYFSDIANEAQQAGQKIQGADGKIYGVRAVSNAKIAFSCDGREISQGKRGYEFFMNHFVDYPDGYPLSKYNGDLDKLFFILALHPRLSFDAERRMVRYNA